MQSDQDLLRQKFDQLTEEWKSHTVYIGSAELISAHPAYGEIIKMGPAVLPFIFETLAIEPHYWFCALREITGEDPVSEADRGNLTRMSHAWLGWWLCYIAEQKIEEAVVDENDNSR
jgi:hypothetical protein